MQGILKSNICNQHSCFFRSQLADKAFFIFSRIFFVRAFFFFF